MQALFHILRDFFQIFHIALRNQHMLNTATQCRQQLLFQTTNRQHLTAQGNLTCHRHVGTNRNLRECRYHCQSHGNTCAWTVFRCCTFRHMDVNIVFLIEIRRNAQTFRTRTHHTPRGCNRLLHHIAQLTRAHNITLTAQRNRFNG